MSNIQVIVTERDEYAEHVIRVLKDMLAIAEAEPQRAVVVHMLGRDTGQYQTHFASMSVTEQVGLLEMAKHNLIALK
jgi:hypothetical protein